MHNDTPLNHLDSDQPLSRKRAGIALLLLVPAPSIGAYVALGMDSGLLGQLVYGGSKVWIAILPVVWLLWVDRQPFSFSPARAGGFRTAILFGTVISVFVGLSYWVFGSTLIDPAMLHTAIEKNQLDVLWRYVGLSVYLITINSLLEEYVWRWFVFRQCEAFVSGPWAAVLSALFFTIHHVVALKAQMPWAPTLMCSAGVFIGGLTWSWCYYRFRSVWPGYVSHAIVDIAILVIGWDLIFNSFTG